MDRQEAERRLAEIAPQVADALGFQLVPRDEGYMAELESPEGWKLFLHPHGWPGTKGEGGYDKLSIGSSWPLDDERRQVMSSDAKIPRINVSINKDPAAIARDVQRRFIPEWEPLWRAAMERVEGARKHEGETRRSALRLAEIVGVDASEIGKDGRFSLYRSEIFPESLSDVAVSGENVKLDLRCGLEEAEEILKAIVRLARR